MREFQAPYAPPDEDLARRFLSEAPRATADAERHIDRLAERLIQAVRGKRAVIGGVEDFLQAYSLSTKEGLALMVLAEALLRVPDNATTDRLIEDKLAGRDWHSHDVHAGLLVSASGWTLGLTARIVHPGETPTGVVDELVKRLGLPAVRTAIRQAIKLLGTHFVLAQTIKEALQRAHKHPEQRHSFDMLGEGARTAADAARYFGAYAAAIEAIGRSAGSERLPMRPGISVKLSALHPRYEANSTDRVARELTPRLLELARSAKRLDLNFTVDAEEADRLELSLDVIAHVAADASLAGWDGFGLAIQAYQKRAAAVIDWIADLAASLNRRFMVRLVKGAYWDTEIKRAQERGLPDYPVFTRKAMTDLNYVACARRLLAARERLYPQFATHNALTVATIANDAGGVAGYEFQRLHGMGEALYDELRNAYPDAACRIYAPVGTHRDLLGYLVRRLLENGANSSFVARAADPAVPMQSLLRRPQEIIADPARTRHPAIPLPRDLYAPERRNSEGLEFGDRASVDALLAQLRDADQTGRETYPLVDSRALPGEQRTLLSPIDASQIGTVREADAAAVQQAVAAAQAGFASWSAVPLETRVAALERAADLFEARRAGLIRLLQVEAGKTLDDAVAEVREAADLCRYYAVEARKSLSPCALPGPSGESNTLRYRGRGVFVCISPWNFPLAIFSGQIAAALLADNAVIAKPAEQSPLIAAEAVRLMHAAGVPVSALHLLPGDGQVGDMLVRDPRVAGIVFTGSTEVARTINSALAAREGPIVPFLAETGGINAMIVDATALPEQVTDDVIESAFRSAGQRCSALRLLCVQDTIADHVLQMIIGAMHELKVGDPRALSTHVGPVIDADAKQALDAWVSEMQRRGALRVRLQPWSDLPAGGHFVQPALIELGSARELRQEVFGPVLHIMRWRADELDTLLTDLAANGTALTLGIQSRNDTFAETIAARLSNGNVYVNRNMIGAVVGTQPFGGNRLSGTGPKAGGPNYLHRFALEQVVTVNTSATGGDAGLLSRLDE